MRILATVTSFLLAFGCWAAELRSPPADVLTLKTGGSPFEAQFTVELSASGLLKIHRFGPPFVKERTIQLRLPTHQTEMLLSLASQSTDFSVGCGQVADGTATAMTILYSGIKQNFACSGAPKWPVGNKTSLFISNLNKQLPDDLQVF